MLAFVDTKMSKPEILARLEAHARADEIVKGVYWEHGRGCAVGCSVHSRFHSAYETQFGIPKLLARIEDYIFEGLPLAVAKNWPLRFMMSVKPGSDLSLIGRQFLYFLLTDESVNPGIKHELVRDAVKKCADVLEALTRCEPISESVRIAANAASVATWNAAYRAESAAVDATASVAAFAWSAASSAWSAASAAASVAASVGDTLSIDSTEAAISHSIRSIKRAGRSAASAAYQRMADKLVELIEAAPVVDVAA